MTDPVLSVRGVTTSFPSPRGILRAIRGVDLELARGERLGIVGESGSGKSALVTSILGLLDPPAHVRADSILLDGVELRSMSERALSRLRGARIGVVFQDPLTGLNPVRRIGPQVAETIRMHRALSRRAAQNEAIRLLRSVEIPEPERRYRAYPHELSGGMRQRVMIAMAIANSPAVLVLDEPTTALDVTTQAQIMSIMDGIVAEHGTAVIFITHNMELVSDFCDRVSVIYAGSVVENGPCQDVMARPAHPYSAALIASIPSMEGDRSQELVTLPGLPPDLAQPITGCAFAARCPLARNRCQDDEPELTPIGEGRAVACHFWREQLAFKA